MMRKLILTMAMCAALACTLAGCGNSAKNTASKVTSDVSKIVSGVGSEISGAASRLESGMTSGASSYVSGMDGDLNSGTVDSGTDGVIGNGDGSNPSDVGADNDNSGMTSAQESALNEESAAAQGERPSSDVAPGPESSTNIRN